MLEGMLEGHSPSSESSSEGSTQALPFQTADLAFSPMGALAPNEACKRMPVLANSQPSAPGPAQGTAMLMQGQGSAPGPLLLLLLLLHFC